MTKKLYLSFRILTSFIFMYAGIGHLLNPGKIFEKLSRTVIYEWMPFSTFFHSSIIISGIVMIAGALLLVMNFKVKQAAIVLLAVLIPITLSVQLDNLGDLGPFFKNIAIVGNLLVLIKIKQNEIH